MSRELDFKYRLIRGGAYCALLRVREEQEPAIYMDSARDLKMSFSAIFDPVAEDVDGNPVAIDWLSDEVQPCLIINGTEHPLGLFRLVTPSNDDNGVTEYVRVETYDRCWRVQQTKTESLVFFAAGTLYIDAIEQLLTAAGIETVLATPSNAVLSNDREDWDIGADHLTIVNQLLDEIGYKSLWFNAWGAAILEPKSVPEESEIKHVLYALDPDSDQANLPEDAITEILPGLSRESDLYDAANVFIVVCANPDKSGIMMATAENNNPQSPLSIQRLGRRVVRKVQVDNIPDQPALQAYADRLRDESMWAGETIQTSTALLPGWGVQDVVALHYKDVLGICISKSYSMQLKVGGRMTHVMERVVYNLE